MFNPQLPARLGIAVAALLTAGAASANLVTNGSFEAPDIVATNFYKLYTTGSTAIGGWTVLGKTDESVQLTPYTFMGLPADHDRQWLDLTGIVDYDKGVRSDAFATTVGETYRISFAVGNYLPFGISTLGLSINSGAEQLFTNTSLATTSKSPMNWATFSVDWVADASSASLSFIGRANGALSNPNVIGLDNVVVEHVRASAVPEPGSWALAAVGLGALVLRTRRQRRA
ncbi:MAG TPA: DUF642 domain-containing protein [Rubrivivax sp.]|nr:DUF642 domain-containing protein [Rubrivivax sp.]